MQELLHELKYNSQPEIGRMLGRVYGIDLVQSGVARGVDAIVPVPLHTWKMQRRGYNQSEEFAKGLGESMNIPVESNVIARVTNTETQTRKSRLKRWENVRDVFVIPNRSSIEGRHVLLVDDVITTGATIEACGHALFDAGCATVSAVSIAFSGE
ncbi:ComF family protein [Oscillatoria amoena NRMC-F 0135]|nr:ComF family protein [Oscillatoria amoena NRMC-F 0135]